jgi:enoyl-CoA hydratase/carnithine racemase
VRGKYFDAVEVKDGVAVIRIDGPGKMNVIDDGFRQEFEDLWTVGRLRAILLSQQTLQASMAAVQKSVAGNKEVKAAVLISSKPDNFIAGADIKMIDSVESFASLKDGKLCPNSQ